MSFNPNNKFRSAWCVTAKWKKGLSSGATFLYVGRTVSEKGVVLVVLEICFSNKALMKAERNLKIVAN